MASKAMAGSHADHLDLQSLAILSLLPQMEQNQQDFASFQTVTGLHPCVKYSYKSTHRSIQYHLEKKRLDRRVWQFLFMMAASLKRSFPAWKSHFMMKALPRRSITSWRFLSTAAPLRRSMFLLGSLILALFPHCPDAMTVLTTTIRVVMRLISSILIRGITINFAACEALNGHGAKPPHQRVNHFRIPSQEYLGRLPETPISQQSQRSSLEHSLSLGGGSGTLRRMILRGQPEEPVRAGRRSR